MSYDTWKAHDRRWDEDARRGPFCPRCGGNALGRGTTGRLCRGCVDDLTAQQESQQAGEESR